MQRDLPSLAKTKHDLLVIGGGIAGAWTAWDASLRGFSVALIDKADFGSATSANSMKIIHSGMRDLIRGDVAMMRAAQRERATLLRIAPDFVRPLPMVVPSYGISGSALSLGMGAYQLLSTGRSGEDHALGALTRRQTANRFPGLATQGLTGGVVFNDGQVARSERFLISMLQSAARLGAHLANYAEVVKLHVSAGGVHGVELLDRISGERYSVEAKVVINAAGPWLERVVGLAGNGTRKLRARYVRGMNLITRRVDPGVSVGALLRDPADHLNGNGRYLFLTPWHDRSLVGTAYFAHGGDVDSVRVTEKEICSFIGQVNRAYPVAGLTREDVEAIHLGLVPIRFSRRKPRLIRRDQVRDHESEGLAGLISIQGAKYTTARITAEKALDRASKRLGALPRPSRTALTPIRDLAERDSSGGNGLREATVHAVREEMALGLEDVLRRRIDWDTAGVPSHEAVRICAAAMQGELAWNQTELEQAVASLSLGVATA